MPDRNPPLIPAGYMLKAPQPRPASIKAPHVQEIASVSGCIAKPFADYTRYWRHNSMDYSTPRRRSSTSSPPRASPRRPTRASTITKPSRSNSPGTPSTCEGWRPYPRDELAPPHPVPPAEKRLLGYDVIECSPLSCNAMADTLPVNAQCLFDTFDAAKAAIDGERFVGCEEGKYRIFAVYAVETTLFTEGANKL